MRLIPGKSNGSERAAQDGGPLRQSAVGRASLPGLLDKLGETEGLDPAVETVRRVVRAAPLGRFRGVLHGRWLGHPMHPALVQVPMGAWLSSAVLDMLPGTKRSAQTLVGVGVVSALPAVLAGWVDWAEQHRHQMRTGLVHAGSNALAVGLFAGSWAARAGDSPRLGRALSIAGLSAAGGGALIGGHMAYRQASGVNKAEPVPHLLEPRWYDIGPAADFPQGQPVRREAGDVPLLVVRETAGEDGSGLRVLAGRCSHCSGPLSEGEVSDGCVKCPWHGSVFRLADGLNVAGPATSPLPSFDVRAGAGGTVQVRLPGADRL